jgi:hypothetical protein
MHTSTSTDPLLVLVADDDDDMRALVSEALRADDCTPWRRATAKSSSYSCAARSPSPDLVRT